jgi:hypothetical protein
MPVTEEQVRAQLEKEEPDYTAAAQLGPDALPVLEKLVRGPDPLLASKAAYLASMIPDSRAAKVLEAAAQSPHVTVRVAAAAGLKHMPAVAEHVMIRLIDDHDEGVRRVALRSVHGKMTPAVRGHIEEKASRERNPVMRAAFHAALGTPVAGPAAQAHAPEAQSGAPGEGGGDMGAGPTLSITGEPGRESGGGGDHAPPPAAGGTGGGDGGGTVTSAPAVEVSSHGGGQF